MLSVSVIRCQNEALKKKNCTSKALLILSASKSDNMQVTSNTIIISPIGCSVRVNHEPDGLLNGNIQFQS